MKPNKPDIKNSNKVKIEAKIKEGGGGNTMGEGKRKRPGSREASCIRRLKGK